MNEKRKNALLFRMLLVSIGPLLLLTLVIMIAATRSIRKGIQEEFMDGLRDEAIAVKAAFNNLAPGDYHVNLADQLMKGYLNISEQRGIIDSFVEGTDMAITVFYGDVRKATTLVSKETGVRIVGSKAPEVVVEEVLKKGKEYTATSLVVNEEPYMAHYIPLMNSDGSVVGMIFAGAPTTELNKYIQGKLTSLIVLAAVILSAACVAVFIVTKKIVHAVKKTDDAINRLSDGCLQTDFDTFILKRNDEIGEMGRSLDKTLDKLKNIIMSIQGSTAELRSAGEQLDEMASQTAITTGEVSSAVDEISKGAMTQAEEVEQATNHVDRMGTLIEQIVEGIKALYGAATEVEQAAGEAKICMIQLQDFNERTTGAIGLVAENVKKTDQSVAAIGTALEMISTIADETTLLSLNASIEAARAGEAGKGFAVVASEIQKLAEESSESANRIAEIIAALSRDSANALKVMNTVREDVSKQQKMMHTTMGQFDTVANGINAVNERTAQMNNEIEKCNEARISVVDIIQNLSALSQENAASAEQTTSAMQELNDTVSALADSAGKLQELSASLENDVSFFKM